MSISIFCAGKRQMTIVLSAEVFSGGILSETKIHIEWDGRNFLISYESVIYAVDFLLKSK